jgi:hypothetical protein
MNSTKRITRPQERGRGGKLGLVAALFAAPLLFLGVMADPPLKPKPIPRPDQGTISPSGKFNPAPPVPANQVPPRTVEEAQAALKQALKISQIGSNTFRVGRVEFNNQTRLVTVPARVSIRTQIVEYVLVTDGGKAYESVFKTEASPVDLHLAFLLLGVSQSQIGGDLRTPMSVSETNALTIDVSWETNGQTLRFDLSELVVLAEKGPESPGHKMSVEKWLYNGSIFDRWGFAAQREGSIISLIRDPAALVNNPGGDRDNDNVHLPNQRLLPAEGTSVQMAMHLAQRPLPPPAKLPPWASPITPLSTNRYDGI